MGDRMSRVDEALKREIMTILQEEVDDPRINRVMITSVEVTRDMSLAKVFYIPIEEEAVQKEAARGLKSASGFIRGELAKRLPMKKVPRLSFRQDRTEERQKAIDELFDKIQDELYAQPRQERTGDDQDGYGEHHTGFEG